MRVNDSAYALPDGALSPGSNVARFRIDGPGTLPAPPASAPLPDAGPGVPR
jgi:hypothetical protein